MTSEVDTPHGPARVHLRSARDARAVLVLGHGAGGSMDAADLTAVAATAQSLDITVALVEPYRVAGRRSPAPAGQLDTAWTAVVGHLGAGELAGLPMIAGGRSSGARVACRTAVATGAVAVLCLAFPLRPPRRRTGSPPPVSRLPELDQVLVPTLVVQGTRDPFGIPPDGVNRTVVQVAGNHGSRMDLDAVAFAVRNWLVERLESPER